MSKRYAVVYRSPYTNYLHRTYRWRWRAREEAGLMNSVTNRTSADQRAKEQLGITFDTQSGFYVEEYEA